MRKPTVLVVAVLLGVAAALGTGAALETVHLGAAAARPKPAPARLIARRMAVLTRAEISLRRALARKPPKLPRVPRFAPVPVPTPPPAPAVAAPVAPTAPQIRYYRPPPIVVHVHRHGGESEGHDGEGGGDD